MELKAKAFNARKLSYFPEKNPYITDEGDDRFNSDNNKILIRVLTMENPYIIGPASIIFPGYSTKLFGEKVSGVGIMSIDKDITRTFLDDAFTDIWRRDIDFDIYPWVTPPALLFLYDKYYKQNNNVNPTQLLYNETAIANIENALPCLTSLLNLEESISYICENEELATKIDELVFYNQDKGSFIKLTVGGQENPDIKLSSMVQSPDKIIDLFNLGKIRTTQEVKFADNILTKDNFENNPKLREFASDCYREAVAEIAYYKVISEENKDVFDDPRRSPLLKILMKDAEILIAEFGKEKIISAFTAFPHTSAKNPEIKKINNSTLNLKKLA